jgi:hypothetical protein
MFQITYHSSFTFCYTVCLQRNNLWTMKMALPFPFRHMFMSSSVMMPQCYSTYSFKSFKILCTNCSISASSMDLRVSDGCFISAHAFSVESVSFCPVLILVTVKYTISCHSTSYRYPVPLILVRVFYAF